MNMGTTQIYLRSMRGQLQSIKFSVNTAVLHAPLAYWHTLKEVLKITLKKLLFFPQHCYIYLKVIVLAYDLTSRENHLILS